MKYMVYTLNWDNDYASFKVDVVEGKKFLGFASVLVENLPATISEYDSSLDEALTQNVDYSIQQKCLKVAKKIWKQ